MKPPKRATRKTEWFATAAAATALIWAVLGLLWAQIILLPYPLLPPPSFAELLGRIPATTRPDRFIVMLFKETSLLLTVYALLGLLMCALAGRAGARKSSLLATLLCVTIAVASLVPVAQATKTASAEGVPLSLTGYFADLSPVPERFADRSPETVPYARSGGEVLKVDIWEPYGDTKDPSRRSAPNSATTERRPAVIVVHGGGWRSGERSDFPSWDAWLADEGYVVFDIDYRLSPPPSWHDAPSDVACAVGWVKENATRYRVDPERVVLMGRSAGGHLALLTAYEEGRAATAPGCVARDLRDTGVAAVVAFYPPTDLVASLVYGLPGRHGSFPRRLTGHRTWTLPPPLARLPRRSRRPADIPGLRRRRPDSSAGAVGAVCRAAAGGRRDPSPGGVALGPPHLRLSLGRMGLADNPLLPRSILGEQPQDSERRKRRFPVCSSTSLKGRDTKEATRKNANVFELRQGDVRKISLPRASEMEERDSHTSRGQRGRIRISEPPRGIDTPLSMPLKNARFLCRSRPRSPWLLKAALNALVADERVLEGQRP